MQNVVLVVILVISIIGGRSLYHLIYGGTVYFGDAGSAKRIANYIMCFLGVCMLLLFFASKLGLVELSGSEEETSQQKQKQSQDVSQSSVLQSSLWEDDSNYENYEEDEYEDESYDGEDESMAETEEEYYVFADSDSRMLKNSELKNCDVETLRLGRNEIYARHGRRFLDAELQYYFDNMPWYEGTIEPEDFKESVLNEYEKKNLKRITRYENR